MPDVTGEPDRLDVEGTTLLADDERRCCLPECLDGCSCVSEEEWQQYVEGLEQFRVECVAEQREVDHEHGERAFADRDTAVRHLVDVVGQSIRRAALVREHEQAVADEARRRARGARGRTRGRQRRPAAAAAPASATASTEPCSEAPAPPSAPGPDPAGATGCPCHADPLTGEWPTAPDDDYPLSVGLAGIEAVARLRVYLDSLELDLMAGLHASASGMLSTLAQAGSAEQVPVTAEQVVVEEIQVATGNSRLRETVALAASGPRGAWLRDQVRAGRLPSDRAAAAYAKSLSLGDEEALSLFQQLFGGLSGPGTGQTATSWGQFDRGLRAAVDAADPEAAAERRRKARAQRGVFVRDDGSSGEGNAAMTIVNDRTKIRAAWQQADALARVQQASGDERTLDALRADIMCHLVQPSSPTDPAPSPQDTSSDEASNSAPSAASASAAPAASASGAPAASASGAPANADPADDPSPDDPAPQEPTRQEPAGESLAGEPFSAGPAPSQPVAMAVPKSEAVAPGRVTVVIPWSMLAGFDDAPCLATDSGTWLPADQARAMFSHPDSIFRVLYVDPPTGRAIKLTSRCYSPSPALRAHVQAIDGTCRFPGCDVPAHRCDLDHVRPYSRSHATSDQELSSAHRPHHNLKTAGLWACSLDPTTHEVTWVSPAGRTYITRARDWLAAQRPSPPAKPPDPPAQQAGAPAASPPPEDPIPF